jgi:hypothetical protein
MTSPASMGDEASHRSPAGAGGLVRVALVMLALGLAAVVILWVAGSRRRPAFSLAEAAALEADANLALAHLENQSLDRAIPLLETVRDRLPTDPFAWRNLAVAHVVALGNAGDLAAGPERLATAARALADARRHEEPTAAHDWLAGLIALAADDPTAAAAAYERIVRRADGDASAWYALSRAWRAAATAVGDAAGPLAEADQALERACGRAPLNLWLAVEWLRATAARISGEAPLTPDLAEAIASRRPAIAPFAPSVKAFARTDVEALLVEAAEDVRGGDRAGAAGGLRRIANVLVPQSAADRAAIERHPLEFIRERFTSDTLARLPPAADADAPLAVGLVPVAEIASGEDGPPVAILLEDIDLDGATDLVVLFDRVVRCYTRTAVGPMAAPPATTPAEAARGAAGWREFLAAEVPAGARGILAADLDLDFDEARRLGEPARSSTDPRTPSDEPGATAAGPVRRCPAADLDLVVHGDGGITCLENRGPAESLPRRLVPFGFDEATAGMLPRQPVRQAAAADLDGDGRLDLAVAGRTGLAIQIGRGRDGFVPLAVPDGLPADDYAIDAILPIDIDRDSDIDLVLGGPAGVGLLENLRHGQFRFAATADAGEGIKGLEVVDAAASWRILTAGAGGLDLLGRGPSGPDRLGTGPEAAAKFRTSLAAGPSTGLAAWDYDNDGRIDLAAWGDSGLTVLRGLPDRSGSAAPGGPRFAPADPLAAPLGGIGSFDAADLDGDGDLDCAVATRTGVVVLANRGAEAHHWIAVDLEAQQIKGADLSPSGRVNAHGLGSLLELKAGSSYQARAVRRRTTHFGLGSRSQADVVRVTWLNGVPQNLVRPPADTLVCEQQILLGSCPYLYARGERGFSFVTDLLWAAPIGLQRAEGELMPCRDHEWLKVPGEMVAATGGRYEFEITEELWEAAYFDQVRLVAVDHPPEVSVWSNEKVGPESIASFGVHTVREPRRPVAIRDGRGRDLLPALAAADGHYAKPWDRKLAQGLVEPYRIEIDLGRGEASAAEESDPRAASPRVTLFLTGWTYPTTVSLNVALSRDPALGLPQPPSLAVPDGRGGWTRVLPFMGFPGGKTKTIAIDLAGLLPAEDPRVRIEGSMEIHWDHVFFTRGEEPATVDLVDAPLVSAVLRPRGFSRIVQDSADGPERFLHDAVSTEPKWPPMLGRFTRYGDVLELLRDADDRLVVIGSGDAIRLAFDAPPPRPGWKRDYLFHSVGWDKDANLATVEGQSVEPLPFRGMRSYPPAADDPPPDTRSIRRWLDVWQTRVQADAFHRLLWNRARGVDFTPPPGGNRPGVGAVVPSNPEERMP